MFRNPMRRVCGLLVLWCVALAPFTQASAQNLPVKQDALHSNILNEDRAIQVLLPEGYWPGSGEKYDVLYVLDGDGDWNLKLLSTIGRFVQGESFMPPFILVALPNTNRMRDFMPTHVAATPGSGGADKFLAFLKNELIPYVDKTYPSNGHNMLFGHSAGGLFAMYALLNEPQLFDSYLAIDPALWWDGGYIHKLAAQKLGPAQSGKSFFVAGRDEQGLRQMGITEMNALVQGKPPKDFRWKVLSYPNENHGSVRFKGSYDGFRFFFEGYADKPIEFHPMNGIVLKDRPYKVYYDGPPQALRYTTDGSEPTPSSKTMEAENSLVNEVRLSAKSADRHDRFNKATTGEFKLGKPLAAIAKPKNAKAGGFHYSYYEGPWTALPDFASLKPVQTGISGPDCNLSKLPRPEHFACLIEGFIEIQQAGYYVFALNSDDGSRLYLGGKQLIDNDGLHDASRLKTFLVPLEPGFYPLRLEYFQAGGGAVLNLLYVVPGEDKPRPIPVPLERQYSDK
jgi:predicted alpha/beta superfamily hydrolase